MTDQPFILSDNLVKIYKVADLEVVALQGLDLRVDRGEMMAIVGSSGSGKSTLLNVLGGLDEPSAGRIVVDGRDLSQIKEKDLVAYKRDVVGFVWQQPSRNLVPYLSAQENVVLPMMLGGHSPNRRKERSLELLDLVGLADRASFRPERLSGGQLQRVALAIALANEPSLLLGDEPTGQVDADTASALFETLRRVNETLGTTIIVVTHDQCVANRVDRVVAIQDGRTSTEIRRDRSLEDGTVREEEWVILDRAGRLQMPDSYVQSLELRDRVKVSLENDHIAVRSGQETVSHSAPAVAARAVTSRPDDQPLADTDSTYWRPKRVALEDDGTGSQQSPTVVVNNGESAVIVDHVSRLFEMGDELVHAVDDISLSIPAGTMVVLKGPSGSGKTTLLNMIAGLDEPTSGTVSVGGRSLATMNSNEKIELRRSGIGFVFQTFGLVPFLSARENIEVPMRLVMTEVDRRQQRSAEVLDLVGLSQRGNHRVNELSGGEQQRVALARALANGPSLLLADEPTGQLDTATGHAIIDLIREIVATTGVTAVIASHDPKVEDAADIVYVLSDGRLVETKDLREAAESD